MENIPEHLQVVNERVTDGLEVVMVWDSEIEQAFSLVHDQKTGERFTSIAPDGTHPKETFTHPYIYRVASQAIERVNYGVTGGLITERDSYNGVENGQGEE
jgi:hypothetical protein